MLHLPPAASRIVFLVVECVHGGAVGQRQLPPSGANLLVNAPQEGKPAVRHRQPRINRRRMRSHQPFWCRLRALRRPSSPLLPLRPPPPLPLPLLPPPLPLAAATLAAAAAAATCTFESLLQPPLHHPHGGSATSPLSNSRNAFACASKRGKGTTLHARPTNASPDRM